MNFKKINEELDKLFEDVEQINTIEDEINDTQSNQEPEMEVREIHYHLDVNEPDYLKDVSCDVIIKEEKTEGNNPDRKAFSTETYSVDGHPVIEFNFNNALEDPYQPDFYKILNQEKLYNLIVGLAFKTDLFKEEK